MYSPVKSPFQKCSVWPSCEESAASISRLNRNTCSPHVAIGCSPHCCVRTGEKFTAGLVVPGREVFYVFKIEKEATKHGSETFIAVFTLLGGESSLCNTLPISHSSLVLYFQWGLFFSFLPSYLFGTNSCWQDWRLIFMSTARTTETNCAGNEALLCLSDYYCWCLS